MRGPHRPPELPNRGRKGHGQNVPQQQPKQSLRQRVERRRQRREAQKVIPHHLPSRPVALHPPPQPPPPPLPTQYKYYKYIKHIIDRVERAISGSRTDLRLFILHHFYFGFMRMGSESFSSEHPTNRKQACSKEREK